MALDAWSRHFDVFVVFSPFLSLFSLARGAGALELLLLRLAGCEESARSVLERA